MSQEALDLRRSLQLVRRHKIIVGAVAVLGLLAGTAFVMLRPPMLASEALTLVVLPPSAQAAAAQGAASGSGSAVGSALATQAVIATSDPVLRSALPRVDPAMSLQTLRGRVHVKSVTSSVLSISAEGKTAAQAERTANAVAGSYAAYVDSPNAPGGQVAASVLEPATTATGTPLSTRLIVYGGLGALLGLLIGAIAALAISRSDRRLRERDEIADAIGVPVLASIPVWHPSDAADWTKLLDEYEPKVAHEWRLRKALQYLRLTDVNPNGAKQGSGSSLVILSLSSDSGAVALGPQLAVFTASLGIPTALIIGPQQDANAVATLYAACAVPEGTAPGRSRHLRVGVWDQEDGERQQDAALTVVVTVVDGRAPKVPDTLRATTALLGVTSGAATAEQLARVAVSAAVDGRQIVGILVADPDPADSTTGRLPSLARPAHRRMPTRLTGTTMETGQ
jgi:capsular polysaccharide biosynthesis protein